MMDVNSVRHMISMVIDQSGGDSYSDRLDKDTWHISRGSANGYVTLYEHEETPSLSIVQVRLGVMKVPLSGTLALYRRLLNLNYELFGHVSFAVSPKNVVVISCARLVADLDFGELNDMILRTAFYADKYDDELIAEFGSASS